MPGSPISFGSHELDPDAAILRRAGEQCALQSQPLRLLALLVERHGQVVTREEIREQLWSDTVVEYDLGINFAIRQIRIALGSDRAPGLVLAVIGTLAVAFAFTIASFGLLNGLLLYPLDQNRQAAPTLSKRLWLTKPSVLPPLGRNEMSP